MEKPEGGQGSGAHGAMTKAASPDGSSQPSEKALRQGWVPSPMGSAKRTGELQFLACSTCPSFLSCPTLLGNSVILPDLCQILVTTANLFYLIRINTTSQFFLAFDSVPKELPSGANQ